MSYDVRGENGDELVSVVNGILEEEQSYADGSVGACRWRSPATVFRSVRSEHTQIVAKLRRSTAISIESMTPADVE